ncbi:hypothetical protein PC9H_005142 [Pleurotus ostreatus]|uniref:Uncharacterized protein n=1 Tax=Pleurotus ostreatus TaxID=5322 RepID=A0A8H7DWR2_PLEOS|nr:uncharacterized protein PC9H_005142 [Pleurotus ostreatus]KAF7433193.1 hypothetical protein PC9H_005142 [Pleurotus ostreatus]KAJ8698162.1 hypothetical protein PTI98_004901 [Pleurotus ostreatus]
MAHIAQTRTDSMATVCDEAVPRLPDDWTLCVHPQGFIYFYNAKCKVVIDADLRDTDICRKATDLCSTGLPDLAEGTEMHVQFLDHFSGNDNRVEMEPAPLCLLVNHTHCVASYVSGLPSAKNVDLNLLPLDPNQLNRLRRMYWSYLWNHPAHTPLPERAIKDATDAITWFYTDNLISGRRSVVPFSKKECEELSEVLKGFSLSQSDGSVAKIVFLAWLLREVCSFRDAEQYGQLTRKEGSDLRLARHDSRPVVRKPGQIILPVLGIIMNILFFGIPWAYLAHIEDTTKFKGRLEYMQNNWECYINRLVREYSHFLLISTVLLSATVSFLAIENINQVARVGATISAFASLGSIIVGVFSIWKHQINTTTGGSFTYMYNARQKFLGHHGHAMLLSLPAVLLIWAITTFTLAMVAYTLQGITDLDVYDLKSSWIVVCSFIVVLVCVFLALHTLTTLWSTRRQSPDGLWRRLKVWWSKPEFKASKNAGAMA